MTDREIMRLYRSGDREQAFRAIVKCYSERLYWHIRRFTCSHEDTDDLLQDTFAKIWAALPSFREDAQLFTWIYRIATNEALNFLRRKKLREAVSFEDIRGDMERKIDSDPYFNGDELQRQLFKAMGKLPPKQRLVFGLRYFEEMPYEEISKISGSSTGSLKASYHHAYNKIKAELEKLF